MLFLDEKSYSVGKYIRLKYDENGKLFVIHRNKPYFVKIMARGTEQECNKKAAALERILDTGHEDNNDDEEESEVNTSGSVSSDKENARESSINKKKALKLPKNQSHSSNVDSSKKPKKTLKCLEYIHHPHYLHYHHRHQVHQNKKFTILPNYQKATMLKI